MEREREKRGEGTMVHRRLKIISLKHYDNASNYETFPQYELFHLQVGFLEQLAFFHKGDSPMGFDHV